MSKTYISVYTRIRPFIVAEKDKTRWIQIRDKLVVSTPECSRDFCYKFDKVFNENSTQAEVYEECTDLIVDTLRGYNCTIFAYGQTGTGKTHTMLGIDMWNFAKDKSKSNPFVTPEDIHSTTLYQQRDLWGIIPRVLESIYNFIESNKDIECTVSCSYLEIYNEKIYDLLRCDESNNNRNNNNNNNNNNNGLEIREIKGSVYVPDAIEMNINTIEEALCLLWLGAHNRSVRATDLNNHSSRSHTLFELIITQKIKTENGGEKSIFSKINLVDLAGSEKWHPYQFGSFTDQRIQEMTSINKSLSNLGNCIRGLANNKSHIPYRNSKLTRLLQDSLGGNSKTLFIITLSPSIEYMDDGISSLQFAERAKSIEVNVNVNETYDNIELLHQYELEIERLKSILQEKIESTSNKYYQNIPPDVEQILKEENTKLKSQVNHLLYIFHGFEPRKKEKKESDSDDNYSEFIDFDKYVNIQSEKMNKYIDSLSHYPPSGVLNENLTLEQRVVQAEWAVVCQRLEISKLLNKQSNIFSTYTSSPPISKSKSTTPIKSTPPSSSAKLSIPSSPIPTSTSKSEDKHTIRNANRSSSTTKLDSRKHSLSSSSLKKEIPENIKFPITKKKSSIRSSSVSKNNLSSSPAKNKVITPISLYGDPFVQPLKKENIKANIWSEAVDKVTGKTYYYNIQTRETTWKKPF